MASGTTDSSERRLAFSRVGLGLAQGLVLYALSEARNRVLGPVPFGVLAMVAMFAPVVVLGALGGVRGRTLLIWTLAATTVLAVIGGYEAAMRWENPPPTLARWPEPPFLLLIPPLLFVVHSLVLAADAEGRWWASYPRYFEVAWTSAVRVMLSLAFLGAFWLLIFIGAGLFSLIDVKVFWETVREPVFAFPASGIVFAVAVHLTDRSANLVRGVRTLALGLLSWLGPVMTLIVLGFLATLPFTGLQPLWETKRATGILLSAAAALTVLVNAAYQDGAPPVRVPMVLHWSGRIAALLLAPLVALAAVGVGLRIGQHGLTPERVQAAAFVFVAAVYALGYFYAALRLGIWLRRVEATNLVAAHVAALILLAILTPIGDPTRLSVANQLGRLASGKVTSEAFDYAFLRFHAGRIGHEALEQLARGEAAKPDTARRAKAALAASDSGDLIPAKPPRRIQARGKPLPADFIPENWGKGGENPFSACAQASRDCIAWQRDLDGDAAEEVLIVGASEVRVYRRGAARWELAGRLAPSYCEGVMDELEAGRFTVVDPRPAWREVMVGGIRLRLGQDLNSCGRETPPRP
jgi:hypothetical protein